MSDLEALVRHAAETCDPLFDVYWILQDDAQSKRDAWVLDKVEGWLVVRGWTWRYVEDGYQWQLGHTVVWHNSRPHAALLAIKEATR